MTRRKKKESYNNSQLLIPNPSLLTFIGSSTPAPEAKRVTFNEMNGLTNEELMKKINKLEESLEEIKKTYNSTTSTISSTKIDSEISDLHNKIINVSTNFKDENIKLADQLKNTDDSVNKINTNFTGITTDLTNQIVSLLKTVDDIKKRVAALEKPATTPGGYDKKIQQLIGGMWY